MLREVLGVDESSFLQELKRREDKAKAAGARAVASPAAPIGGVYKTGPGEELERGPGLGWTPPYESNLYSGWKKIVALVDAAMPEAAPEVKAAKVDEAVAGGGPGTLWNVGASDKVIASNNFKKEEAQAALEAIASGSVDRQDLRARGADALTAPAAKTRARADKAAPAPLDPSPAPSSPCLVDALYERALPLCPADLETLIAKLQALHALEG